MYLTLYPWPQGCFQAKAPQVQLHDNIFNFDRTVNLKNPYDSFLADAGCTNSCGLTYDEFEDFQQNAYWRVGGGLQNDTHAFRILKKPAANGTCSNTPLPPSAYDWLSFDEPKEGSKTWQYGKPPSTTVVMDEDRKSTVIWNPKFGTTGKPSDYLLKTKPPISGFDITETNNAILHAGRTSGAAPVSVLPTFPTYIYTSF
jgi:hypothetical protein